MSEETNTTQGQALATGERDGGRSPEPPTLKAAERRLKAPAGGDLTLKPPAGAYARVLWIPECETRFTRMRSPKSTRLWAYVEAVGKPGCAPLKKGDGHIYEIRIDQQRNGGRSPEPPPLKGGGAADLKRSDLILNGEAAWIGEALCDGRSIFRLTSASRSVCEHAMVAATKYILHRRYKATGRNLAATERGQAPEPQQRNGGRSPEPPALKGGGAADLKRSDLILNGGNAEEVEA